MHKARAIKMITIRGSARQAWKISTEILPICLVVIGFKKHLIICHLYSKFGPVSADSVYMLRLNHNLNHAKFKAICLLWVQQWSKHIFCELKLWAICQLELKVCPLCHLSFNPLTENNSFIVISAMTYLITYFYFKISVKAKNMQYTFKGYLVKWLVVFFELFMAAWILRWINIVSYNSV